MIKSPFISLPPSLLYLSSSLSPPSLLSPNYPQSPPLPTARVKVDGANGVGADKLVRMMQRIPSQLSVQMYNDGAGALNEKVCSL